MLTEVTLQPEGLDSQLKRIAGCEWDAVALSSHFTPSDLSSPEPGLYELSADSRNLLRVCSESLRMGGLLFVYGAPCRLPAYAEMLYRLGNGAWKLEFKYWIGIQLHACERRQTLDPSHVGILLFHKVSRSRGTPFRLNTVRVPHRYCSACGQNVRDWGGKKHLMSPNGSALSDVWTDLPMRRLTDNRIPQDVLDRITNLSSGHMLHIIEDTQHDSLSCERERVGVRVPNDASALVSNLNLDRVEVADCIDFMGGLLPEHEHGAFDLIFADPPYNLTKPYTNYTDAQAEEEYLAWCDRWLESCARLLKPGGSMFVVNLPKWALGHARTLDRLLDFRHWIVWHAPAEPRGKLLPAHYALLYYTKPGAPPVFNYDDSAREGFVGPPDSPEYCLRIPCVRKRRAAGDDRKVALTDVWFDVHRIRHKRDRDYHPCQLPEKLLERVVLLTSNPGQVVFDPFCGVGTTAVVAKRLDRRFLTTDTDPEYARITEAKLEQMGLDPARAMPRASVPRQPRAMTKRRIESVVQEIARELGRMPEMADIQRANPQVHEAIHEMYPNPRKALGAARVVLNP